MLLKTYKQVECIFSSTSLCLRIASSNLIIITTNLSWFNPAVLVNGIYISQNTVIHYTTVQIDQAFSQANVEAVNMLVLLTSEKLMIIL
jgi:hypothetical protein